MILLKIGNFYCRKVIFLEKWQKVATFQNSSIDFQIFMFERDTGKGIREEQKSFSLAPII